MVAIAESGRFDGERIDACYCFVLPGGVDPHVHMLSDVPAADQALHCGATTALSFTWPADDEDPIAAFERARDRMVPDTSLDVALPRGAREPRSRDAEHLQRLAELGVSGGSCMSHIRNSGSWRQIAWLYDVMRRSTEHGLAVQVHCENGNLIAALTAEALAAGRTEVRSFFDKRPVAAEEESVHRMLCLPGRGRSPADRPSAESACGDRCWSRRACAAASRFRQHRCPEKRQQDAVSPFLLAQPISPLLPLLA